MHSFAHLPQARLRLGSVPVADADADRDLRLAGDEIYRDVGQASIASPVLESMLGSATGAGGRLTPGDMSRFLGKRRVECRNANPQFNLSLTQKFVGSIKYVLTSFAASVSALTTDPLHSSSFLLKVFGGIVADLRTFLLEERLPDGWEPRVRHRAGLTMIEINFTVGKVELGVEEG